MEHDLLKPNSYGSIISHGNQSSAWVDSEINRGRFLGAFAKLRKWAIRIAMSVRQFVRMEQLVSHWTGFNDIWNLTIF
jgi:hypothetical protein